MYFTLVCINRKQLYYSKDFLGFVQVSFMKYFNCTWLRGVSLSLFWAHIECRQKRPRNVYVACQKPREALTDDTDATV